MRWVDADCRYSMWDGRVRAMNGGLRQDSCPPTTYRFGGWASATAGLRCSSADLSCHFSALQVSAPGFCNSC